MKPDHLLDVFHALIHRQAKPSEKFRNHPRSQLLVAVKAPAKSGCEPFGVGLSDVVQKRRPSKPPGLFARCLRCQRGQVVEYLEGVVEVVLVFLSVDRFDTLEKSEFGEDQVEDPAVVKNPESYGRHRRTHDLLQFIDDALRADDRDPQA